METIQIRPTAKQREASRLASTHTITLFGGAIRGGKSYWLLLLIFTYAMQYDRSRWAVIRASYATLKQTLIVTFNKLLSEGLGHYIKNFNQQDLTVTLTNGSQIIFFSENYDNDKELNRFRGLEVNGFGIDEINEIQEQTFYKCIERAGSWQGSKGCEPKILATCNPANNWVKEKFYDRWEHGTLPESWCYVPSKITDNPHIEQGYLESLKLNMLEHDYDIFVNGNWNIKIEGLLFGKEEFKYFKPDNLRKFDSSLAYADIADEGSDATAVAFARNIGSDIYITDVLFDKNNSDITIPLLVSKIKEQKCDYIRVESNNMGAMYGRELRNKVQDFCTVYPAVSTSNKLTRILMDSGFIKRNMYFLEPEFQSEEYKLFMKEVFNFMKDGSSKHDDAPDCLSGLSQFVRTFLGHLYN